MNVVYIDVYRCQYERTLISNLHCTHLALLGAEPVVGVAVVAVVAVALASAGGHLGPRDD